MSPSEHLGLVAELASWRRVAERLERELVDAEQAVRTLQDDVVREYGMGATSDFIVSRTAPLLERLSKRGGAR